MGEPPSQIEKMRGLPAILILLHPLMVGLLMGQEPPPVNPAPATPPLAEETAHSTEDSSFQLEETTALEELDARVAETDVVLREEANNTPAMPSAVLDQPDPSAILSPWEIEAAQNALENGFPRIALTYYRRLLQAPSTDTQANQVSLLLPAVTAALATGDVSTARAFIERLQDSDEATPYPASAEAAILLRRSWLAYLEEDIMEAAGLVAALEVEQLNPTDRAWFHLLEGLFAEAQEQVERALEAYTLAREVAPTEALQWRFELLLRSFQLRFGEVDEDEMASLRASRRALRDQVAGVEAARLLAVAMYRQGEVEQAIMLLEDEITLLPATENERRSQLLLQIAFFVGAESVRGRMALREVLRLGRDRERAALALSLLQGPQVPGDLGPSLPAFIDELLINPMHPLRDVLLALRSRQQLQSGALDAAEADARRLLEEFPGSPQAQGALQLLAYAAWSRQPPRYRTAASYLDQLRQTLPEGPRRGRLGVLLADCYFLNGDFDAAAAAYAAAQAEVSPEKRGRVLYQRVLVAVRSNRLDEARRLLDQAEGQQLAPLDRWRAEWNLLHAMKVQGTIDRALDRVLRLLGDDSAGELPLSLRLRLRWLEARLSVDARRLDGVAARARSLFEVTQGASAEDLDAATQEQLASHALLLEGEALLLQEELSAASEVLTQLRDLYPEAEATLTSYLTEARTQAAANRLVDAQRTLISLADTHPTDERAPVALWEAAIYAEARALPSTYREAIGILERLATRFPDHPLVYYTRLRQGDLSRKLGDFAAALSIYEETLSRFPRHPERFRAELSRADALLALASEVPARRADALAQYERIAELADAPAAVRAEATFKWAYGLATEGRLERAAEVYFSALERFVPDAVSEGSSEEASQAGATSADNTRIRYGPGYGYWVARSLFELAAILESQARYDEMNRLYRLIAERNLPGAELARARLPAEG